MKIIEATKDKLILQPTRRDENFRSFVFDIGIVPELPEPKVIIIRKSFGRKKWKTWPMTWKKFLKQTCIDTVCLIDKTDFTFAIEPKLPS